MPKSMNSTHENLAQQLNVWSNVLNFKKMIAQNFKAVLFFFGIYLSAFAINSAQAQCKADSIVNYRVIAGNREIASIEYFEYDLNDSILSNKLIEYYSGKAMPLYENKFTYSKVKGNTVVSYENAGWDASKAVFKPVVKVTHTYSKKGVLISEIHDDLKGGASNGNDAKIDYTYTPAGLVLTNLLSRWSVAANSWMGESLVEYEYENNLMARSTTSEWDSLSQNWKAKWRTDYVYDNTNTLSETVAYKFENYAWIPDQRTYYGYDSAQAVKGTIVQKWNGGKRGWDNQSYYVQKLNTKGQVETEVHLSWSGKDWVVDLTFHYVYNELGQLIQILNDKREVMVDRFCR
jgi:hypothetical protein